MEVGCGDFSRRFPGSNLCIGWHQCKFPVQCRSFRLDYDWSLPEESSGHPRQEKRNPFDRRLFGRLGKALCTEREKLN